MFKKRKAWNGIASLAGAFAFFFVLPLALGAESALERPAKRIVGTPGNYGYAGCGLGSIIWGRQSGQLFAATTNSIFYNQALAITFGTSNCDAGPEGTSHRQKLQFVAVNYHSLKQEMAQGEGENLRTLAVLLECPSSIGALALMSQRHHGYFFEVPASAPAKFLERIEKKIALDPQLSLACRPHKLAQKQSGNKRKRI